jgi:hypothetical protein
LLSRLLLLEFLLLLLVRDVPGMCAFADNPFAANTRAVASTLLLLLVRAVPGMSAVAGTLLVTNLPLTTTSRQGHFYLLTTTMPNIDR